MRSGRERRERSKEGENRGGKDTSEKVEYLPYVDKIILIQYIPSRLARRLSPK